MNAPALDTIETLDNARTALVALHKTDIGSRRFESYADLIRAEKALNFTTKLEPLYRGDGTVWTECQAHVRADNGFQLGNPGFGYRQLQNVDVGATLDALFAPIGGVSLARPSRVRAYDGGRVCSIMFDLPDALSNLLNVRRDGSERSARIVATWSHDGSKAFCLDAAVYRRVCENGMMGWRDLFPTFKVKHTAQIEQLTDKLKGWLTATGNGFKAIGTETRRLDNVKLDAGRVAAIVGEILDPDGKQSSAAKKNIEAVTEMIERRDGTFVPAGDVTLYTLLEAFTAYDAHRAPVRADTPEARQERRELRVLGGDGIAHRALDVLHAHVN